MSIFYKGVYKVEISNQSYINAIMEYNAKTWIELIKFKAHPTDTGVKTLTFERGIPMSQLQEQINKVCSQGSGTQEIEVQYGSVDSRAMFNVLHTVNPDLYKQLNITSNENKRSQPRTTENYITDYLRDVIFRQTNIGEMEIMLPPLPVCSLSREKTIELVFKQSGSSDFKCIELTELQTIVFGSFSEKAACFYVTYGEKFDADDLHHISFDIDDGFVFKYKSSPKTQQIRDAMQVYFEAWKNKNYEGSVFPQELSLSFAVTKTPEHVLAVREEQVPQAFATSSIITRGHPLYKSQVEDNDPSLVTVQIHIDTDNYANYQALDPRVISMGSWMECSPMRTSVTALKQHEQEIIELLKKQPGVQFVNSEITEYGVRAQAEKTRQFSGM